MVGILSIRPSGTDNFIALGVMCLMKHANSVLDARLYMSRINEVSLTINNDHRTATLTNTL